MPSDEHNSIMTVATGLISSLFKVPSSGDVPFRQPKQLQCLHHGCTKAHLCCNLYSIPFSLGTFTTLVFSATGGMAVEANVLYKELASLLSNKWDAPYSAALGWVRYCLSFSLLRSSIRCICGSRSSKGCFGQSLTALPIDLVQSETKLCSGFISLHN